MSDFKVGDRVFLNTPIFPNTFATGEILNILHKDDDLIEVKFDKTIAGSRIRTVLRTALEKMPDEYEAEKQGLDEYNTFY